MTITATERRKARPIVQRLRVARLTLEAPYRPGKRLPKVEVTALLAQEDNPPPGEEPITWLWLTRLPVDRAEQAIETLQWYCAGGRWRSFSRF